MARKTINITSSLTSPTYPNQILYLKRVDLYLSNAAERAKKVKYCVQEGFNGVIMYGVDGIISNQSYWPNLKTFIAELRAAGVTKNGIAYSNKSVVTFLNSFQDSTSRDFDFGISEIEPWVSTSGVSWSQYNDHINTFKLWANSESDYVDAWTYQGWINKPTGTSAAVNAFNTIKAVNKVCLHHYNYPLPIPSYGFESRWKEYARQAVTLGYSATKKLTILPIYSAEQDYSQEGFKTKAPVDCYTDQVKWIDAQTFTGKDALNYKQGFIVFKDTDLMVARPLKP
jgi:hypothetical protein